MIGTLFTASACGYRYQWRVTSNVFNDTSGRPYVIAKPVRRLPDERKKKGALRSETVWYLTALPPEL